MENKFRLIQIDQNIWELWLDLKTTSVLLATGSKSLCMDIQAEEESNPLPTPAVEELNLVGKTCDELAGIKYPFIDVNVSAGTARVHNKQMLDLRDAYVQAWADCTHHNHASFVALVEGEIEKLNKGRHINEDVYETQRRVFKVDALTDLLNKIKKQLI